MKPGRQSVILKIISERDIETQHQLMQALAERGIKSTQATLSRDIKDMRLIKELGPNGNYRYVQAARPEQVREVWHFVCSRSEGDSWKLDGIQQLA